MFAVSLDIWVADHVGSDRSKLKKRQEVFKWWLIMLKYSKLEISHYHHFTYKLIISSIQPITSLMNYLRVTEWLAVEHNYPRYVDPYKKHRY